MAQSMDYCQHCGDMIDAAEAGICYTCFHIQQGNVICNRDGCNNHAIRLDFTDTPICKECGREE